MLGISISHAKCGINRGRRDAGKSYRDCRKLPLKLLPTILSHLVGADKSAGSGKCLGGRTLGSPAELSRHIGCQAVTIRPFGLEILAGKGKNRERG